MSDPQRRQIESNGIRMQITELGSGPPVLLLHGWPELAYSWRHQMRALAEAGFHAIAPDLRGYGKSEAPLAVETYDIHHITADVIGILDAVGESSAALIGHDWGSIIAAHCALTHPDRFESLVLMSVPYLGRPQHSIIELLHQQHGENFFYILYFQEPGAAEAEFDADPHGILSRLYISPDTPRDTPPLTDPAMSAGGWIPRLGKPHRLPDWLTPEDMDFYVTEFARTGFRGGFNYYRNFQRNWETTPELAGVPIQQPTLFLAGEKDVVIRGADQAKLRYLMNDSIADLRDVILIPRVGHWVQQESPKITNQAIIEFLT